MHSPVFKRMWGYMHVMRHEIETSYIIDDVDAVKRRIMDAGFVPAGFEHQENVYLTHPFFPRMVNDKQYLRFRYCSNDTGDTRWGEVSFSNPVVEHVNGTPVETRRSFSIQHPFSHREMSVQEHFLTRLGFKRDLVLVKDREYHAGYGTVEASKIHVELDTNIYISSDGQETACLEPTIQFCIESTLDDIQPLKNLAASIASRIGIKERATSKNYFDRYRDARRFIN